MLDFKSGLLGKSRDLHNNVLELLEMFGSQKAVQHFNTDSEYQCYKRSLKLFFTALLGIIKGDKNALLGNITKTAFYLS